MAYRAANRLTDGLPLLEQTLRVQKGQLGPTHPSTLTTINNLGRLKIDLMDYPAAEALLLEYQAGIEKNARNLAPGQKMDALPNLVRLYDAWGKPAEAEEWFVKLPAEQKVRVALERQHAWPLLWGWPRL